MAGKNQNNNRIRKILIITFVLLLMFSVVLNIVLLWKVWQLDQRMDAFYTHLPYFISM
ncbi:MAG: hypothetical protein K2G89_10530 [Lachnospiraceae bacterium]|nr:hypothetical protein [Lachnospiraceae bacterium]